MAGPDVNGGGVVIAVNAAGWTGAGPGVAVIILRWRGGTRNNPSQGGAVPGGPRNTFHFEHHPLGPDIQCEVSIFLVRGSLWRVPELLKPLIHVMPNTWVSKNDSPHKLELLFFIVGVSVGKAHPILYV
jgi:hypothetical protein